MFLESLTGKSRKDLAALCEELSADLKKKQSELEVKEKQVHRLAKNNRRWTRKYHELEKSISENQVEIEPANIEREQETKTLQMMLIKLNRKNTKLEQRVLKMAGLLKNGFSGRQASDGLNKESATKVVEPNAVDYTVDEGELEPEFPAEFQKVIDKYTESSTS